LGDILVTAEEASFNFDLAAFYSHFLNLIRLAQKEDGSLPDFVPPYNPRVYPADPAWGSAYISLCWHLYYFYGDQDILRKHFQNLKNYVEFLRKKATGQILYGLGKYGDWCQPGSLVAKKTPLELVSTWFYYHDLWLFSKICEALGRQNEAREYQELAQQIKGAFNGAFLDGDQYRALRQGPMDCLPDQTANILPLYLNMVPEEKKGAVLHNLLESIIIHHDYHLDTGVIGTRFLLDVLSQYGFQDVALRIILQDSYPGWGYMIKEGATTLWERWEKLTGRGMNSHNHIMFGSVDAWLYKNLAGLEPLEPGWKTFQVKPYAGINSLNCRLMTIPGPIEINWQKSDYRFQLDLQIPVNTRAKIFFPTIWPSFTIKESNLLIWEENEFLAPEEVSNISLTELNHLPVFWVESGQYSFVMEKI
ncbi:MAG: alpha-L-rhamnosidase C-terminal domain-containing protein, partial [Candidatus Saccharicenans sp.]